MSPLVKTKSQAYFKDFKRFRAFSSSNKETLCSTRSCVNWAFFGTRGPLKWATRAKKKTELQTNSLRKLPTMTDFQIQKVIDTNVSTVISRSRLF
jgi:hypothetical protein